MSEMLEVPGHPGLRVAVVRSTRARRLSLRVGRRDGAVRLTLPKRVPLGEARAFVAQQADWIARNVAQVPPRMPVEMGAALPLLGRHVPIRPGPGRVARYTGDEIRVPNDSNVAARVQTLLKTMARTHLVAEAQGYAAQIDRLPGKITLRDTRSRWGSCTSRGDLMFSWRLIMAPPEVLSYVAAHEVAHLVHMDHSPRFWAQVGALMPSYAQHRDWFKTHGAGLLAWDFTAAP